MTYLITLEEWFATSASISNFNRHFWMKKSFCKYMRKKRFHQALNWRCPEKILHLCIQLAWLWLNFAHRKQHFCRKTEAFPMSASFLKQKICLPPSPVGPLLHLRHAQLCVRSQARWETRGQRTFIPAVTEAKDDGSQAATLQCKSLWVF